MPSTNRSARIDVAVGPVVAPNFLRGMGAVLLDDDDAQGRTFVDGLEHIGRLQRMTMRGLMAINRDAVGNRNAGGGEHEFG